MIHHPQTPWLDGEQCFHCDGLFKLDLSLRLNLRKALKVDKRLSDMLDPELLLAEKVPLSDRILKFHELSEDVKLSLEMGKRLTIYLKLQFKSVGDLVQSVKRIYGEGFKECIDFEESPTMLKLNWDEYKTLQPSL